MPLNARTLLIFLAVLVIAAVALLATGSRRGGRTVVVYTSVDAEVALPVFERFTKVSGIQVVTRTDSEASKTTGLAERLLQMKGQPDGDVFWNSELSFTQMLAREGALQPYVSLNGIEIPEQYKDASGLWTGFGCRARVLIFNTNKVKRDDVPRTLEGLADPKWKGRFCIARSLYGTTRSHLVGLVLALGEEKAFKLFRSWRDNGLVLAESNSDVRNRVADGTFDLGLTDSDDAISAKERNKPVDFTVPDQTAELTGVFLIPNTVSILKNCPHLAEAKAFVDFLLLPEIEAWLGTMGARQIPVRDVGVKGAELSNLNPVKVDAEKLGAQIVPLGDRIDRILRGEEK
ncbi:MAG TPA: extracellular solute-binding protein [Planctomycetota bacterium]|jgi:iron(III) transport system substrate-binding protein